MMRTRRADYGYPFDLKSNESETVTVDIFLCEIPQFRITADVFCSF